jgi:hypothetical protein
LDAPALQKIALTIVDQTNSFITARSTAKRRACQLCRIAFLTDASGNVQFLAQMPTETKLFLGMAVLGLTGTLIVLKWLV